MSLEETRLVINVFEDLVRALKLAWTESKGAWTKTKISPILDALRVVYFPPSGSLSILEKYSKQESVSQDEIRTQLEKFEGDEPNVAAALNLLSFDANKEGRYLHVRDMGMLDAVRQGKISVRRNVHGILSELANGRNVDRDDVAKTVAKIKELNSVVDELDVQLDK